MGAPTVDKCANHDCPEQFRKIGDGKLYVFPVSDPEAWGLPKGLRQKVVWLCQGCWRHFYIRFDRKAHTAILVARQQQRKNIPKTA